MPEGTDKTIDIQNLERMRTYLNESYNIPGQPYFFMMTRGPVESAPQGMAQAQAQAGMRAHPASVPLVHVDHSHRLPKGVPKPAHVPKPAPRGRATGKCLSVANPAVIRAEAFQHHNNALVRTIEYALDELDCVTGARKVSLQQATKVWQELRMTKFPGDKYISMAEASNYPMGIRKGCFEMYDLPLAMVPKMGTDVVWLDVMGEPLEPKLAHEDAENQCFERLAAFLTKNYEQPQGPRFNFCDVVTPP